MQTPRTLLRSAARAALAIQLAAGVLARTVAAQDHGALKTPAQETTPKALPYTFEEEPRWEVTGSLYYSDPPGSEDRLTPIVYADRGSLHLEARYNYEDLETLGLFAGWTFEAGSELTVAATPMLGVALGETQGIAPALALDLGWKRVAAYSEMEYLFDADDRDDDFFYSWSTLTYGFTEWLDAGIVAERSRLVDDDLSVQRGLALELKGTGVGLSFYGYNLGTDDSYAVVALELAP